MEDNEGVDKEREVEGNSWMGGGGVRESRDCGSCRIGAE